jgi:hypothetical protein
MQQPNATQDWRLYLSMMEQVLDVPLDEARRAELLVQFQRIANIAAPLLNHPLDRREEIAGVFKP